MHAHEEHINQWLYIKVFLALLALTLLTFIQPYLMHAQLHTTVAIQMFLAIIKTILIVAYYMHLKYESKLFKMIVLVAVVTLCIFFIITATDAVFRDQSFDMFR